MEIGGRQKQAMLVSPALSYEITAPGSTLSVYSNKILADGTDAKHPAVVDVQFPLSNRRPGLTLLSPDPGREPGLFYPPHAA